MNGRANYSTTSEELLCKTCKHSQIVESSQGGTAIVCHYTAGENGQPHRLDLLVTKCNRYEQPEVLRLWDTSIGLKIEDGHCWMLAERYVPELGTVTVRADTMQTRRWILREFPGRVWNLDRKSFEGDGPIRRAIRRIRRLW
jgi:hypothetical protein